jgi:hypothetical protein
VLSHISKFASGNNDIGASVFDRLDLIFELGLLTPAETLQFLCCLDKDSALG